MTAGRPGPRERADIAVAATVRARELRVDEASGISVDFTGHPAHDSHAGSERTNLPDHAEPGVTYRSVRVDYLLEARLVDGTEADR